MSENEPLGQRIVTTIKENNFKEFVKLLGKSDEEKLENANHPINSLYVIANGHALPIYDNSPFLLSAMYGRHFMLQYMLSIPNIDVNQRNSDGHNALFHIMTSVKVYNFGDKLKCMKHLLSHSLLDVNAVQNRLNDTALMLAVQCEHYDMLKLLLKHSNIDVNLQNNCSNNALMYGIYGARTVNVRLLLQHPNIDVNMLCDNHSTVLFASAKNDDECGLLCMRQLLNHRDIDINYWLIDAATTAVLWGRDYGSFLTHALLIHGQI